MTRRFVREAMDAGLRARSGASDWAAWYRTRNQWDEYSEAEASV
jgi:hypothetical protein